jgi:site-specific DNA recombinase
MRVAMYARYSSDQQRDASIEDQFRECSAYAEREGWTIAERYSDAALSGSSSRRPGFQSLVRDAERYDIVLAESLDRLSRDMEDTAGLHKRLSFVGVRLVTISEGEIGHLHVGLKSTMNALMLKDLADKTRRGLRGRVEAGKSGGGNSYGYRVVRSLTDNGMATGEREIDVTQAAIVNRVFREYANGDSPKAIVKRLNAEGVRGPAGGPWGPTTIHGHVNRGTGLLNNRLYVGELVWNRLRYIKDPSTGKRVSRLNPPSAWTVTQVPALRIVSDELWQAVKARQGATQKALSGGTALVRARRPTYLFTGLTKCGVCGSGFTMFSKDRLACAGSHNRGTCDNRLTIRRDEVEARVLKAMEERLWNDELFEEFCAEFVRERNRLHGEAGAAVAGAKREIATVEKRLAECMDWIATGEWRTNAPMDAYIRQQMTELLQRKSELDATIAAAERAQRARPLLHPGMGKLYREWVVEARDGLRDVERRSDAMTALRSMLERIVLTPEGDTLAIRLEGDLASILATAVSKENSEELRRQVKVVAGAGFEPATFGL